MAARLYTVRLDYADGSFELIDVEAFTLVSALLAVADHPYAVHASVVGSVDRAPQVALAF